MANLLLNPWKAFVPPATFPKASFPGWASHHGMVWYGMVGVPTTSLGHRQHQSAEGEKRAIWLPTTCTDAHIVHNSFFDKLHHKRQKKRQKLFPK